MRKKRAMPKGTQVPPRTEPGEDALWGGSEPVIIVPLDGSIEAKAALPTARLIARILGATVNVVHVTDEPLSQAELLARVKLERDETHGLIVDRLSGSPTQAVLRFAEEKRATSIVATTRGRTAYSGRTVGPVVEEIMHTASCPVLLVRPEIHTRVAAMTEMRSILLPLDGAPSSAAVIGPAMALAQRSGVEVDVLFVATRDKRSEEPGTLTVPRYIDQPQHEWPAWAREFVTRFLSDVCPGAAPLPTPTRMFLRHGEPTTEILRFSVEHDSDLIVLEWRGRLDPAHGDVVKGVLGNAPSPVLLLRTVDKGSDHR